MWKIEQKKLFFGPKKCFFVFFFGGDFEISKTNCFVIYSFPSKNNFFCHKNALLSSGKNFEVNMTDTKKEMEKVHQRTSGGGGGRNPNNFSRKIPKRPFVGFWCLIFFCFYFQIVLDEHFREHFENHVYLNLSYCYQYDFNDNTENETDLKEDKKFKFTKLLFKHSNLETELILEKRFRNCSLPNTNTKIYYPCGNFQQNCLFCFIIYSAVSAGHPSGRPLRLGLVEFFRVHLSFWKVLY